MQTRSMPLIIFIRLFVQNNYLAILLMCAMECYEYSVVVQPGRYTSNHRTSKHIDKHPKIKFCFILGWTPSIWRVYNIDNQSIAILFFGVNAPLILNENKWPFTNYNFIQNAAADFGSGLCDEKYFQLCSNMSIWKTTILDPKYFTIQ